MYDLSLSTLGIWFSLYGLKAHALSWMLYMVVLGGEKGEEVAKGFKNSYCDIMNIEYVEKAMEATKFEVGVKGNCGDGEHIEEEEQYNLFEKTIRAISWLVLSGFFWMKISVRLL